MYLFHEEVCGQYRFPSHGLQNESKTQARYLTKKEKKNVSRKSTVIKNKIVTVKNKQKSLPVPTKGSNTRLLECT